MSVNVKHVIAAQHLQRRGQWRKPTQSGKRSQFGAGARAEEGNV